MSVTTRGKDLGLVLMLAAGLGLLGGCCSLGIKSCPTSDQLTFIGDQHLNSCSGDQYSYPVAVRLYYLSQAGPFESAEFQDLWENDEETLGATKLGPATSLTVTPGGESPSAVTRPDGAAYLGIVANFCRLDGGPWRWTLPLDKGVRATVRLKEVHLSVD